MEARINLNDCVWVVLNSKGWDELIEYYQKVFDNTPNKQKHISISIERHKNNVEKHLIDGEMKDVLKIQLSEFMEIFGKNMYCGADSLIENNNIYLSL